MIEAQDKVPLFPSEGQTHRRVGGLQTLMWRYVELRRLWGIVIEWARAYSAFVDIKLDGEEHISGWHYGISRHIQVFRKEND